MSLELHPFADNELKWFMFHWIFCLMCLFYLTFTNNGDKKPTFHLGTGMNLDFVHILSAVAFIFQVARRFGNCWTHRRDWNRYFVCKLFDVADVVLLSCAWGKLGESDDW